MGKQKRTVQKKLSPLVERPEGKGEPASNNRLWWVALLVAVVTLIVYLPARNGDFLNWDDNEYVSENPHIRHLNMRFFLWIFQFYSNNWHPLTWLSHAIDYRIWKLNPMGHHLTNIILHSINTFLLCLLVAYLVLNYKSYGASDSKTTGFFSRVVIVSGITALLFGIHPLHVESVAWVSERKDVLSTFFVLLSLLCYVRYVTGEKGKRRYFYFGSLLFCMLALMSKPMAVTLPVILILLDFFPFQRFSLTSSGKAVLLEKVPFIVVSIISAILNIMAQYAGGSVQTFERFPLESRILVAFRGVSFYLGKMLFPGALSPVYPYPKAVAILSWEYIVSILLCALISVCCILAWKRGKRSYLTVWAYFIVTLLPVLGIIQVGSQAAADRYTYIPSIGPFVLAGLGVSFWIEGRKSSPLVKGIFVSVPLIVLSAILGLLTVKQIAVWKNSVTLWSSVIEKYPEEAAAYFERANYYNQAAKHDKALEDMDRAIALKPLWPEAYNSRGLSHAATGNYVSAIKDFSKAIELRPTFAIVYNNRAKAYISIKNYHNALMDFNSAIALEPAKSSHFYSNRCILYVFMKDHLKAIQDCSRAIEMDGTNLLAFKYRAYAYNGIGRKEEATSDFQKAARLGDGKIQEILKAKGISW